MSTPGERGGAPKGVETNLDAAHTSVCATSPPLLSQCLGDRLLGKRGHDLVSRGVRMQSVVRDFSLEEALVVHRRRKVIQVDEVVLRPYSLIHWLSARIFSGGRDCVCGVCGPRACPTW